MTLVGVGVTDGDDLTTIAADAATNGDINYATSSSPYKKFGSTELYLNSATSTYSFGAPTTTTKNYVFAAFEAKGRDTTIAPDISSAPSGWAMGAKDSTTKYLYYEFTAASTATTAALTVEDATYSIKEAVYTAPASMTDTGPVVFK